MVVGWWETGGVVYMLYINTTFISVRVSLLLFVIWYDYLYRLHVWTIICQDRLIVKPMTACNILLIQLLWRNSLSRKEWKVWFTKNCGTPWVGKSGRLPVCRDWPTESSIPQIERNSSVRSTWTCFGRTTSSSIRISLSSTELTCSICGLFDLAGQFWQMESAETRKFGINRVNKGGVRADEVNARNVCFVIFLR